MKALFDLLHPGGEQGRLSILIFHRVLDRPDPLFPDEVDVERFDTLCRWLRAGFNVVPLADAIGRLRDGSLPPRAMAITFDDGYEDNHRLAMPTLRRHGLSATFFVSTRFLDGGVMWNDRIVEALRQTPSTTVDLGPLGRHDVGSIEARRTAIAKVIGQVKYLEPEPRDQAVQAVCDAIGARVPQGLMMRSDQVRDLVTQGMDVGGHTESHPILARLDAAAALAEISGGKQALEQIVQAPMRLFAYPNGKPQQDYTAATVELARQAGFEAAVSTAWGAARRDSDLFQLPRFTPWDRSRSRFVGRLIGNLWRRPVLC